MNTECHVTGSCPGGLIWTAGKYSLTYSVHYGENDVTPILIKVEWWRSRSETPHESEATIRRSGDEFSLEWGIKHVPSEIEGFITNLIADELGA
jgi:hypothetical protein